MTYAPASKPTPDRRTAAASRCGAPARVTRSLQLVHWRASRAAAPNRSGRPGSRCCGGAARPGATHPLRPRGHAARRRSCVHRRRGFLLDPSFMTRASQHVQSEATTSAVHDVGGSDARRSWYANHTEAREAAQRHATLTSSYQRRLPNTTARARVIRQDNRGQPRTRADTVHTIAPC